jgi:hypothetical protein
MAEKPTSGVPFQKGTPFNWSEDVLAGSEGGWVNEPASGRLLLRGVCPRCEDPESISEWLDDVWGTADAATTDYVQCRCVGDHPGRPATEVGCGARGQVEVQTR